MHAPLIYFYETAKIPKIAAGILNLVSWNVRDFKKMTTGQQVKRVLFSRWQNSSTKKN